VREDAERRLALCEGGTSLLPVGIVAVDGRVRVGDAWTSRASARHRQGDRQLHAAELRQVAGLQSAAVREVLPRARRRRSTRLLRAPRSMRGHVPQRPTPDDTHRSTARLRPRHSNPRGIPSGLVLAWRRRWRPLTLAVTKRTTPAMAVRTTPSPTSAAGQRAAARGLLVTAARTPRARDRRRADRPRGRDPRANAAISRPAVWPGCRARCGPPAWTLGDRGDARRDVRLVAALPDPVGEVIAATSAQRWTSARCVCRSVWSAWSTWPGRKCRSSRPAVLKSGTRSSCAARVGGPLEPRSSRRSRGRAPAHRAAAVGGREELCRARHQEGLVVLVIQRGGEVSSGAARTSHRAVDLRGVATATCTSSRAPSSTRRWRSRSTRRSSGRRVNAAEDAARACDVAPAFLPGWAAALGDVELAATSAPARSPRWGEGRPTPTGRPSTSRLVLAVGVSTRSRTRSSTSTLRLGHRRRSSRATPPRPRFQRGVGRRACTSTRRPASPTAAS